MEEYDRYTRAAEALYISQATLSQQIIHLEELLRVFCGPGQTRILQW